MYCTIDTSRVGEGKQNKAQRGAIQAEIEKEIRTKEDYSGWRCVAVIKDPKNATRIRVACQDENELQTVKQAAEKATTAGKRVLRGQLFPVRVDNTNRLAVINEHGQLLPRIAESLGEENDVHIAKIAWLSKKDSAKAYKSIVIYVTKGSEARRLLQGQHFYVARESAYKRVFERYTGLIQYYKC